jgi:hypothetical protein
MWYVFWFVDGDKQTFKTCYATKEEALKSSRNLAAIRSMRPGKTDFQIEFRKQIRDLG